MENKKNGIGTKVKDWYKKYEVQIWLSILLVLYASAGYMVGDLVSEVRTRKKIAEGLKDMTPELIKKCEMDGAVHYAKVIEDKVPNAMKLVDAYEVLNQNDILDTLSQILDEEIAEAMTEVFK